MPTPTHNLSLGKRSNQKGFGLVEVLVSFFIMGVMLLLFQIISNAVVLNKYNRFKEIALRVAEKQIQTLRTISYGDLPESGSFSDAQLSSIPSGAGNIVITEEDDGLKRVQVTVTWRNPQATADQSLTLETYISRGGLGQ
jgi:type II secretory pathway pseudopilin PulG